MTEQNSRKVFVRAGEPVGMIGGDGSRFQRENDALLVVPDERWGNPVFGDACLDESDFHIHARLTLDRLAGTGASLLLGGHYHYNWSRPDGNLTFRLSLDEDIYPARKTLDKPMRIVHGRTDRHKPWSMRENLDEKDIVGPCEEFVTPGEPFTLDLYRRGEALICQINGAEAFRAALNDDSRITPGRSGDDGWPISVGFLPGRGTIRIHEFYAEGQFPGPEFPTTDAWRINSGGYSCYRMPSVCMTAGGRLLAFSEARRAYLSRGWERDPRQRREIRASEIHCAMTSSDDDGRAWSPQDILLDRGTTYEARVPSPLMDWQTGEIFLFTWEGPWLVSSRDEGRTWSAPRSLADAVPGEFKNLIPGSANCAIQLRRGLHKGRLLLALDGTSRNNFGLIYSDDHGRTWQPGALTTYSGACEPSIVELSDGRVLVSPRIGPRVGPGAPGRLFMLSNDGGCTFAPPYYEPAIPIPGQGEMIGFDPPDEPVTDEARPIVFCGATDNKTNLTMIVSLDDGKTWPISRVIDTGSAANLALVALPQRQVGVLYERDKYRRLSFQRVDLDNLINDQPLSR